MFEWRKIGSSFHEWYYPLLLFSYILALFAPDMVRPGVVSAVLVSVNAVLLVTVVLGDGGLHNITNDLRTEDIIMLLWAAYNILSGIWCIYFGSPPSVYLGELFTTALPMLFYFYGRRSGDSRGFSRNYLISVAVIGLIGIILYIAAPDFYIDYLMRLQLISKADTQTMRVRMHSVIGSTLMGYLPAIGMLVSVRLFMDSEERRKKSLCALSFIFMLFLSFMSNQRSAMAAAILIIAYLNYLVFFVFRTFPKKYFLYELLIIMALVIAMFFVFNGAFMKVYYRLVSLPGSIAQRSDQWVGAANNMKSIWLGNGLGANGHRAIGYTEHLIADGGIAKLYVESGIAGSSLFTFLILLILKKCFKHAEMTAPEAGIVLITLLMSIGSNMMSFALSVPIFYYYMGRGAALAYGKGKNAEVSA